MTKPIDSVKDAIRALHEHINALGVAAQEAAGLLRKAISDAIDEITGGSKKRAGRPPRAAAVASVPAAPKAKSKSKAKASKAGKGGKRGAKPGGRQLKAFLGLKAYEALSDDLRAKGRNAISALKDEWKEMSRKEQADVLAKAGVHASAGGAAPAKAMKPRKPGKAKAAAVAPKAEDAVS